MTHKMIIQPILTKIQINLLGWIIYKINIIIYKLTQIKLYPQKIKIIQFTYKLTLQEIKKEDTRKYKFIFLHLIM